MYEYIMITANNLDLGPALVALIISQFRHKVTPLDVSPLLWMGSVKNIYMHLHNNLWYIMNDSCGIWY